MNRTTGMAHSVHVRLVARAKERGIEAQMMLGNTGTQTLFRNYDLTARTPQGERAATSISEEQ